MSKKLIPIIASILAIPAALAATPAPVTFISDLFKNNLSWLFVDFTAGAGSIFWLRVMIWIVLFAAFYALLTGFVKAFAGKKNISVTISMVMALISAIFIPDGILISIGKSYGITVTILLMGLPIGAAIYLMYIAFPTGKTNNKGEPITVSRRKVNHAIKAILYYLIFTLLGNYIIAFQKDPIFTRDVVSVAAWGAMAESFAMIAMVYHLFAAIFVSEPSAEGEGEEGWLARMIREGRNRTRETVAPTAANQRAPVDLNGIRTRIGDLSSYVNSNAEGTGFEDAVRRFGNRVNEYRAGLRDDALTDEQRDDLLRNVFDEANRARIAGERVEAMAVELISDRDFVNLQDADFINIGHIMRWYRQLLDRLALIINEALA